MAWGSRSTKKAAGTASSSGWSDEVPEGQHSTRRTPTDSSYYDFDGQTSNSKSPDAPTWMYARDVRAQQARAPEQPTARQKYPSYFYNAEGIPLSTPGRSTDEGNSRWLHHPLTPGKTTLFRDSKRAQPGAVRAFYTEGDRTRFDVGYHDPRKSTTKATHAFSLATYVSKAK